MAVAAQGVTGVRRSAEEINYLEENMKQIVTCGTRIFAFRNHAKLAGVAAAAVLAFTAFGLGDARAAFDIKDLSCTTDPFGVHVDVSGLGGTNICIEGSATLNLDCACVGGGGNCPSDAKKQTIPVDTQAGLSVEPKNGRVNTTFTLPISISDGLCTEPQCGSGQDTKLIQWDTQPSPPGSPATFTVCTTVQPAGQPCTCAGAPTRGDLPETTTCGPTSDIVFSGKKDSCLRLF
jgi:hypothetical protein